MNIYVSGDKTTSLFIYVPATSMRINGHTGYSAACALLHVTHCAQYMYISIISYQHILVLI